MSQEQELINVMSEVMSSKTRTIISVVYASEQKSLKKSRVTKEETPERFQNITKFSVATCTVGAEYENLVNAQRAKEGETDKFYVESHRWAEHVDGKNWLLRHKKDASKLYLQLFPTQIRAIYCDANLKILSPEEVKEWKEHFGPAEKDPNGGWQDLNKPVLVINPALENILYIQHGGKTFGSPKAKAQILEAFNELKAS